MITVSIVSDLHLEMQTAPVLSGGDVLLLAGDTWTAAGIANRGTMRRRFEAFCKDELAKYGLVFIVHGNHEFYGSALDAAPRIIRDFIAKYAPNAIVLDNACHCIGDVAFIGSTFWATHAAGQGLREAVIQTHLADFTHIRAPDGSRFTPAAAKALHGKAVAFIEKELERQKREGHTCIVVTHHAPSYKSKAGRDYPINLDAAFYSDCDDLIEANPHIALWCHGHSHASCRSRIGKTVIVSNQRGYLGSDPNAANFHPDAADFQLETGGRFAIEAG